MPAVCLIPVNTIKHFNIQSQYNQRLIDYLLIVNSALLLLKLIETKHSLLQVRKFDWLWYQVVLALEPIRFKCQIIAANR